MSLRYRLLAAVALLAFLAGAATASARLMQGAASKAAPSTSNLLVYAQEWSLWTSRTRIPAGTIHVQLSNRGEDAHDLRVRALNAKRQMVGAVLGSVTTTQSGSLGSGTWHLRAGRYEIYCSLPGHLMMGMHADITVTG